MLTEKMIMAEAATKSTYDRGIHYYRNGHVKKIRYSADERAFVAVVQGGHLYTTLVEFDEKLEINHYGCDCPAFHSMSGACKHVIALLAAIKANWTKYFPPAQNNQASLTPAAKNLLYFFQKELFDTGDNAGQQMAKLVPVFYFSLLGTVKLMWVEFSIGIERMYVLKDIPQFLTALNTGQEIIYGQKFTLKPDNTIFAPSSQELLDLLRQTHAEELQRAAWGYHYQLSNTSAFAEPRRFRLTDNSLHRFLTAVRHHTVAAVINNHPVGEITVKSGRPPLGLTAQPANGGLLLTMDLKDDVLYGLDTECKYLYHNKTIYHADPLYSRYIKPLLKCFADHKKPEVFLPAAAVSDFTATMLPSLEKVMPVQIDAAMFERFCRHSLEPAIYLDRFEDGISARIEFKYGDAVINPIAPANTENITIDGKWLIRDTAGEMRLLNHFKRQGFAVAGDKLVQPDEAAAYAFLRETLPELQEQAEIYHAEDFNVKIRPPGRIAASVRLNTDKNLLEFSLDLDSSPQELIELLTAYKLKKRYHRLKDGAFIPLDTPEFQVAAQLIDQLGLRPADIEKKLAELPKYRALYLDSLARDNGGFFIERNRDFKKMVQDIREPQDMEYVVPAGVKGKLREYQKTGFKWLKTLACYGLGGILADDMGLGKTLQVLAFLLSEKESAPGPSIVVAPTSLVYNWQEEAAKFTPDLKVAVIAGQQNERAVKLAEIDQVDLIVTSYGSLKRDIEFYENRQFKYCIIDEAQHIKNPHTQNAQSVKRLRAASYFALTGTPIENNLTELWSIFDFLMPGYLGSHKAFTSQFEIPIVKNNDQAALRNLSRQIAPFILRRMKKTVLKELPAKSESKMTSDMTSKQAKLYQAWLLQAQAEFEREIAAKGFEQSHIKILSLLTRLRQICCHPSLFLADYNGGSGKMDLLDEIIKDALAGGHRILLFSQFTGMLDLIRSQLDAQNISCHYLDGSTKAEERLKLVHAFNNGEKDVFLLSLKAGGTGLNLTGADVVIHYDPWWNPAVEDQATDRAYRIGQNNPVHVYKLITKNTIEEKIYLLQQKKKEIIDTLIKPGEHFLTKLSENEIRELFKV